jgi:hypothetical protein
MRACSCRSRSPGRIGSCAWLVDTNETERDLISSIGHELRHVVEVLSDPTVTSDAAIYNFYLRNYPSAKPGEFETTAATRAGLDVRAELKRKER